KLLMSVPLLNAGEQTTLNCSAPDPCPSTCPNITWWIKKNGQNSTEVIYSDYSQNYTHVNGTITSMLPFIPSVEQHNAEIVCAVSYGNVTFNVTRTLQITKKGETLNLNCSAESNSHPLNISWSFRGASGSLQNKTTDDTLTITSVSSEHAGEYVCTVQKFNLTLNTYVKVTVILSVRSILTFLVGAASTAVIFCIALCFVGMCIAGTDQAEEDEHTPLRGRPAAAATHTAAVRGEVKVEDTPGEDRPSGEEKAAGEKEQNEVDYACIDYSLLQDRGAEAQKEQSEETEYAEIQIKKQAEEEGAEDLQGEEVQGEAQGLENQEQVEG
uniref:Ig-like domain-containing protein n=1 Tax=Astyanax mexicanus TaxID=7994 RepID=A0A3B1JCY5_ASTMX